MHIKANKVFLMLACACLQHCGVDVLTHGTHRLQLYAPLVSRRPAGSVGFDTFFLTKMRLIDYFIGNKLVVMQYMLTPTVFTNTQSGARCASLGLVCSADVTLSAMRCRDHLYAVGAKGS